MDIIDKIDQNLYSYDEIRDMEIIMEMAMIIDDDTVINEAFDLKTFKSGMQSLMKGVGIGAHRSGEGLIQIALKSGKTMAEFVWHAFRAAAGKEESKTKLKELARKEITKEQFLDFLLKLDMATLHMVSGPLHLVDALTGWHIWAHIKSHSENVIDKAKAAIRNLVDAAKSADSPIKKKLKGLMHGIARLLNLEDEQKLIAQVS